MAINYLGNNWGTKPPHNKATVRPVCKDCGTSEGLMKDKRRAFGVKGICNKCHSAKYHQGTATAMAHSRQQDKKRKENGYEVVDGGGILFDGSFLYWRDVHSVHGRGIPDGTIIKKLSTGTVYEVWNKPVLMERKGK